MNTGIDSAETHDIAHYSTWFGAAVPERAAPRRAANAGAAERAASAVRISSARALDVEERLNFFGCAAGLRWQQAAA